MEKRFKEASFEYSSGLLKVYAGALFVWLVINAGFIVAGILLENQFLVTVCAILACKIFFEQTIVRIKLANEAWHNYRLSKKQIKEDL